MNRKSRELSIELSDIQKIIESDWDDDAIRLKIGEFVLSRAIEQDKDISALIDIKFVKEPTRVANISLLGPRPRCCRGRV